MNTHHVGEVWGAYRHGDEDDPDPYVYAVVKYEHGRYTLLILSRALFAPGSTCEVYRSFFESDTTRRIA